MVWKEGSLSRLSKGLVTANGITKFTLDISVLYKKNTRR